MRVSKGQNARYNFEFELRAILKMLPLSQDDEDVLLCDEGFLGRRDISQLSFDYINGLTAVSGNSERKFYTWQANYGRSEFKAHVVTEDPGNSEVFTINKKMPYKWVYHSQTFEEVDQKNLVISLVDNYASRMNPTMPSIVKTWIVDFLLQNDQAYILRRKISGA
jgi:hypothetical protein